MTRFLLSAVAFLLGLLVFGRLHRAPDAHRATSSAASVVRPAGRVGVPAPAPPPPPPAPLPATSGTPSIDLLARLEGRRRLLHAGAYVYFDSLFAETDSIVRRWADRGGQPFHLAVPPTDSAGQDARLTGLLRRAAAIWEDAVPGIRFVLDGDSTRAQITARFADRLTDNRAGQTDLQWTRDGAIHSAVVTIAKGDRDGRPLPEPGLLAVAIHELGHALGLAHSPRPDDVMFSAARTTHLSSRDRATMTLLYELPLGSVREAGR